MIHISIIYYNGSSANYPKHPLVHLAVVSSHLFVVREAQVGQLIQEVAVHVEQLLLLHTKIHTDIFYKSKFSLYDWLIFSVEKKILSKSAMLN